jgi:hypothetical protein
MISAVLLVVYTLAVARVTRLVTADKLTEGPRERLIVFLWRRSMMPTARAAIAAGTCTNGVWGCADAWARRARADDAEPPLLVYLLTCPWCVSVYVAALVAPVVYWWGDKPWFLVPAMALAMSHVTGLLAKMGD